MRPNARIGEVKPPASAPPPREIDEETRALVVKACAASDEVVEQANALCEKLEDEGSG